MEIVHRSTVTADMIDGLGHMNVRYYGVFADRATQALLAAAEVVRPDQPVITRDIFTRHHREQLAGAELGVRSGFVSLTSTEATLYHELFNTESEVLAATFVRRVEAPGFLHDSVGTVDIPVQGMPRSLSLDSDPLGTAPTLVELAERGLAMRYPRIVGAEECGPDGQLRTENLQELFWRGEPVDPRPWDMRHAGADGAPIGMAVVESRTVLGRLPRAGDEVQSFGALTAIGDKTTTRRNWVYLTSGAVLMVSTSVGVALDLRARRAVSLPPSMRAEMQSSLAADLDT